VRGDGAHRHWRAALAGSTFQAMPSRSDHGPIPYPKTQLSVVLAAREDDPEIRRAAFETLITVYWRPVYSRLRMKWRAQPADAEDLAQEFFARAMERGFLDKYDPDRARFRTFLRTCLDHFAANARRDERRLKRGGGATMLPLDFAGAERELAGAGLTSEDADSDAWFDHEWVRSLFADAVDALRRASVGTPREIRFIVFERHDLHSAEDRDRPSYRALGEELGLPVTQVTNHLAWARRELRKLVLARLRVLSGSDAEFRDEAEALFGDRRQ
jgi:RNA polymerase sigma factor (sigma-70 family)